MSSYTDSVKEYKINLVSVRHKVRKRDAVVTTVIISRDKKTAAMYLLYFRPLSGYKSYGWAEVVLGSPGKYLFFSGKKKMMKSFLAHLKRTLP